jgi:antitoxin (DNA-binding transcriptional repressor) of toxin-antitoxin stability system
METKWIDVKKENMPLKKLLELVASGLDVVLTEDKSPVARVVPVEHKIKVRRMLGLHAGQVWVSPDFDNPLPDSFWLGEEDPA